MRKMCVLAGIAALAVTANACLTRDTQISIDRALNSPTLTIHYKGAHASLVEFQLNGVSLGTRSVDAAKDTGDTNFTLNLNDLKDGDNEVLIRLFDRTGKQVGSDKRIISTDQSARGPVFLASPKVGATVIGPVEISLGFGRDLKATYVNFFVDGEFKKMTNYPPYSYLWDSTRASNGWHTVEGWAMNDSGDVYKSKATRVFVNNPGGRTDRQGVGSDAKVSKPSFSGETGIESGSKNVAINSAGKAGAVKSVDPKLETPTRSNTLRPSTVGGPVGIKPAPNGNSTAFGVRDASPTGNRIAKHPGTAGGDISIKYAGQPTSPGDVVYDMGKLAKVSITRGQHVPNVKTFAIKLDSAFVKFDVQPRVDNGVPMTPLRYLLEQGGGKVDWSHLTKTVTASADGKQLVIRIGDKNANVDQMTISMEATPYIDHGRTIVPLSFLHDALGVNIEYDKETNHVLITSAKK